MSEDSIPRLRPPRPTGRDLPTPAAIEFALAVAGLESHHRMAAYFDSWRPGDIGHPPAFPQAVMDLFGQMSAFLGSDRKAESFFRSRHNWDLLRPIYSLTTNYGHFGRELPEFTWERTDRADALAEAVRG